MKLKKFFPALVAIALVLSATSFRTGAVAASDGSGDVRRGEVVVEIKPGASIEAVNQRNRTTTILQIYGTNFYRLQIPANKKENKWRKRLAVDADVLSASLNPLIENPSLFARATASFPEGFAVPGLSLAEFQSQQRLFDLLKLEDVTIRSQGAGSVVAVIDTGVDREHAALAAHMWTNERERADGIDNDGDGLIDDITGWNFVESNNDATERADDPHMTVAGHGTFIAGLVAMLAPACRIMPVKAFPPDGVSDAFTVAAAIKFAADHGADVINLSLGSSAPSDLLLAAIEDARARGITIVAAVGNDNTELNPQFPSTLPAVMAVAAIELSGQKASFSNFGSHVDVCAPGVRLVSTFPGNRHEEYARWSGTSFAAPLAAAEAALVVSADPRQPDVKKVIEDSAINIDQLNPGFEGKLGKGRIDPLTALQSLNSIIDSRALADVHSQIELSRGPGGETSYGRATIAVKASRQEFTVEAHMLNVRSTYKLIVDGNQLASDISASLGSLTFSFVTEPGLASLPPSISPVTKIHHVELRDLLDRIVLQGNFSSNSSNPVDGFVEREARLLSTGFQPQAAGNAFARIEALETGTRREQLGVAVEGLTSGTSYALIVDGTNLGSAFPKSGFIRVLFTSDGSSGQLLPPWLRPVINIRHVEFRDSTGRAVVRGDFASTQVQAK